MDKHSTVKPGIFRLSVNLDEDDIDLFEGLWPIPHGVSINSYFVKGDKGALIDLFGEGGAGLEDLEEGLSDLGFSLADIHYVVLNHMEPDHTGVLPELMAKIPHAQIYCTEKASKLVASFYKLDGCKTVKTGDSLDLGGGKVLNFIEAPNLHWPETMVTYESSQKVLFSCDAFGGFGAIENAAYDEELNEGERQFFLEESLRYYADIVGAFSSFVLSAIKKIKDSGLEIQVIAPSHGLIWRKDAMEIVRIYEKFAGYEKGPCENEVTLIWSSMYGNTEAVVEKIIEGVRSAGVDINIFRVPQDHVSFILPAAYRSGGLIIGMPTYEYKMFPPMAWALDMLGRKHVHNKKVLRFGSFGWSGGAQKELDDIHTRHKMNWLFHEPIEWHGGVDEGLLEKAFATAQDFALQVKAASGK